MVSADTLIRGLDRELYNRVMIKAKQEGKKVADLMNDAMRMYLTQHDGEKPSNPNDPHKLIIAGTVFLSKSDLQGIFEEKGKFHLENRGNLTLGHDIDREAFHYIEKIHNTGKLKVPKHVHHLALLKADHIGGEFEKYEPTSPM